MNLEEIASNGAMGTKQLLGASNDETIYYFFERSCPTCGFVIRNRWI
jgi:hypothetical protein